jgi:8-oxo-dGTP pyrophosphatase MutT (NUDIX family)
MLHQDLASLLEPYRPADASERGFRNAFRSLLKKGDLAFSPDHFVPGHFTASSFLLSPCQSDIGLIFHGKLRRWLQPGGHFSESDPSCIEAARRELMEETGITGASLIYSGIFDLDIHEIPKHVSRQQPLHKHFDLRFLFKAESRHALAGSDAKAFQWCPVQKVSLADSDASVMRAIRKIEKIVGS